MNATFDFDICIVGAGVVGLAITQALAPHYRVLLIERHSRAGEETSSRNSEVIHAGIYYPHDSLKQRWCLRGKTLLYEFCQRYHTPFNKIGKLIVAQSEQLSQLQALHQHGQKAGVELYWLQAAELKQREPAVSAAAALYSPSTGIIDSHALLQQLEALAVNEGALVQYRSELMAAQAQDVGWQLTIATADGPFELNCHTLINSAGLGAQSVAQACSGNNQPRHIPPLYPCRGQYFRYHGRNPVQHLIYPIPDANLTGLGIHTTVDLAGQLKLGPDTHYQNQTDDYHVDEHARSQFAQAAQRYLPDLEEHRLQPDYSGIRPKLSGPSMPARDFFPWFSEFGSPNPFLHLFGIESPGLTASLAIAEAVTNWLQTGENHYLMP
ncbi:hypothetical protein GCM10011297_09500 [Bacterioplanes sanyensis]|uniref:NAD(P)/FAD-dependent oxidoreductase n=1 Tax=Bacterioplanes sanyensis TaxID=1249553 RepID=UPI0019C90F6A|nr:NAD(P)/FAD-dependent oxidoreductase [Bacterioplanes sanyensis]GGY38429.1 hypothetical protein GCM10011297_09500 [Bacterioplanes sanyensis]